VTIRVLVVEDEPVAAAAHRSYIERVEGFGVAGVAGTVAEALRLLAAGQRRGPDGRRLAEVDVVLLDMHLPDGHGLDVVRAMRSAGHPADVIAVTSARDLALVRASVSQGIVQYLLKPFAFAALRDRLERYAEYREQVAAAPSAASQEEVDRALAVLRPARPAALPKGLSQPSLDAVVRVLRASVPAADGVSAGEVAAGAGMSRVTARRYLEHLVDAGAARRSVRYGGAGRPEVEYTWVD
jgi:response regulator of citrate/malate metabolism